MKRYVNQLSVPWYSSKHPVHGPYNPNKKRVKFLLDAEGEQEMRMYLEEFERKHIEERAVEEESGGEFPAHPSGGPSVVNKYRDGRSFQDILDKLWLDEQLSTKTWREL